MLTTKVLYQTVMNLRPWEDGKSYCEIADEELNQHLADGWEIFHIGIVNPSDDHPKRIVTLSREILP